MSRSPEITLANPSDIPALCQLLNVLFSQEPEFAPDLATQSQGLSTIIDRPTVGHIFVARHDGEVVGMVSLLYTVSTALGGTVALLEDMIVSPDVRGAGFGSRLLSHAIEFARDNGCKRLTLLTDRSNFTAQRFYRRHGFSPSSMIPFRLGLIGSEHKNELTHIYPHPGGDGPMP